MALLIVHKPGHAPRLGHTIGAEIDSVRKWKEANPGAAIYVVLSSMDLPNPGTAWVQTADELIATCDMLDQAMDSACHNEA